MAAKFRYVCQQCGATHSKWSGRCDTCGAWNSLVEEAIGAKKKAAVDTSVGKVLSSKPITDSSGDMKQSRITTTIPEIDAVLGGGILPGGVILLAGQPGVGKSTLLMQVIGKVSNDHRTLYASGEESFGQIRSRAARLFAGKLPELQLVSTTSADDIAATIDAGHYDVIVVDSMQTVSMAEVASAPGSVSQITNSANIIIRAAKRSNTAVILVGHVTKEGSIAGPKVLEHLVDVVMQFESDVYGGFKVVRASKNRYGSTDETAILDMTEQGLVVVDNPSAMLLAERQNNDGSVIHATVDGNRSVLVEIQALVSTSNFGYPKRTSSGFDLNRLNILIAVLEKRTKLQLGDKDIFINVVGGVRLTDPAADLAIVMAIASAASGRKLADDVIVFGEVGLGGEIRSAFASEKRLLEASKLGFEHAIVPKSIRTPQSKKASVTLNRVADLRQALVDHVK